MGERTTDALGEAYEEIERLKARIEKLRAALVEIETVPDLPSASDLAREALHYDVRVKGCPCDECYAGALAAKVPPC